MPQTQDYGQDPAPANFCSSAGSLRVGEIKLGRLAWSPRFVQGPTHSERKSLGNRAANAWLGNPPDHPFRGPDSMSLLKTRRHVPLAFLGVSHLTNVFRGSEPWAKRRVTGTRSHSSSQVWYKVNSLKPWEEQLAVELGQRAFWPRDQGKVSPRADICTGSRSMRRLVKAEGRWRHFFPERERKGQASLIGCWSR